jgi:hypothetical protein
VVLSHVLQQQPFAFLRGQPPKFNRALALEGVHAARVEGTT